MTDEPIHTAGGFSVLVVDDDADARRILSLAFSAAGHRAVVAENGMVAMRLLQGETPSAVVLDLRLPELDGLALARLIRARRESARVPIVAVTAFAAPDDRQRALAAGCDAFLTKPVDPDDVVRAVATLAGRES